MKLTKKLIEQMVREAVRQYAVDPDQFFTQSPLGPQADKLKALAKTDPEMAKELGYTPEIEGDEIVFSGEPIMDWIVDNYLNQPEPEKGDHPKIKNTIIDFYLAGKEVLFKSRPDDPFGKEFLQFEHGLYKPIMDMYKRNKDKSPEEIIKKMVPIIAKHRKEHSKEYNDTLTSIFKGESE